MFSSQFIRYFILFSLFSIIFGKIINYKYIGIPKLSEAEKEYYGQKILFGSLPTASKFKIFDNNYYLNQLPYENEYRYYGGLGGSGRIGGAAIVARKPVYSKQKVLHVPSSVNHYVQHSIGPIMETNFEGGDINPEELYYKK
uniref:Uncharacterized protein n=1 Tax=Meloidogyne enterolobii TaxID=390850 RepID=A0A6V7VEA1_MELEN|nr:unnamed protein product [Meloidogyne enterolobii]